MDSRGIEPRTTPMLREYYTTKPQAHLMKGVTVSCYMNESTNMRLSYSSNPPLVVYLQWPKNTE